MKKLHVGTDVIAIKDAMIQVQRNIEELSFKKREVNLGGYAGKKILEFYEAKIATQSATLDWLKNAL